MLKSLLLATLLALPAPPSITDGRALVRAMHDHYAGKWYQTLTFRQETLTYQADGTTKSEIWNEKLACPGKLRIDIGDPAEGNRYIFANDTLTVIEKGKKIASNPLIHPLLVLGFDVYCQPVESTVARLEKLGFDLSIVRETKMNGTAVYVVGAREGDTKSPQFWIEKDRLVFLGLIRPDRKDPSKLSEITFEKYEKAGGGWVAAEVNFRVDGKMATKELYSEIKAGVPLDDSLFTTE